jgi:amino-acid N-acetyltransferase
MTLGGILFVCADNASRSQIAEALARDLAPPGTDIFSAGTAPTALHPCTVRVLREIGLTTSRQRAKGLDAVPLDRIATCVTLDPEIARPSIAPGVHHFYAPFDDPAGSGEMNAETLDRYRALRDQLQSMLLAYFRRCAMLAVPALSLENVQIRAVRSDEVDAVCDLLRACRLPVAGIPSELSTLLVAMFGDQLVGSVGLERHGDDVLLRSLAVAPAARRLRLASILCEEAETRAQAFGAARVFLLTETAQRFFEKRGYAVVDRSLAPAAIAASREFSSVCPAAAVLMARDTRPRACPL